MNLSRINKIWVGVAACAMMLGLVSCKAKTDSAETQAPAAASANEAQSEQAAVPEEKPAPEVVADAKELAANSLPAYQFAADDPLQKAIADYLIREIGKNYEPSDVCIPSMTIVATDATNPEDTRVWGDFWIFNYKLNGDTLETASGGSHPGLVHLNKSDEGFVVTKMDVVADGADNLKSAKEVFGDKYDDFHKINSNQEAREKVRLQFISDYVNANKLSITKVKDFGWDPVVLP